MERIYLKQKQKQNKLMEIGKELGADYIEDNRIVFKIPKKYGSQLLALAICKRKGDNSYYVLNGIIDEDCDNFIKKTDYMHGPELEWQIKMFKKILNAKTVILKNQ